MLSCLFFLIWRYFYSCCELSHRGLNWRFAAITMFLILLQRKGQVDGGMLEPAGISAESETLMQSWIQAFLFPIRQHFVFGSTMWFNLNFFLFCVVFAHLTRWICDLSCVPTCTASLLPEGLRRASYCLLVRFVYYYWIKIHRDECLTFEFINNIHRVHVNKHAFQWE